MITIIIVIFLWHKDRTEVYLSDHHCYKFYDHCRVVSTLLVWSLNLFFQWLQGSWWSYEFQEPMILLNSTKPWEFFWLRYTSLFLLFSIEKETTEKKDAAKIQCGLYSSSWRWNYGRCQLCKYWSTIFW